MLFLVTFQESLNFIYEGIKCLYSILNCNQFMQIKTAWLYLSGSSENNTTFHVIIMGKHVGLTVFICGLEVKTTKVDNHQFNQLKAHIFQTDLKKEPTKTPKNHCMYIMNIQWLNSYLEVKSVKERGIAV